MKQGRMKTVKRMCALLVTAVCATTAFAQTEVLVTGLQAPQRLALTSGGNFLVTESGTQNNTSRVAFITRGGTVRGLIEALPSGADFQGDQSGATALALRERTLYVTIGVGDTERRNQAGMAVHNGAAPASALFATVLRFRFSSDIDQITGTFRLTDASRQSLANGEEVELTDGAGARVMAMVLSFMPVSIPEGPAYRFSNPWGLAVSNDGNTLWMNDASQDALYRIDTATGRWQRVFRFAGAPNPTPVGPPRIDAVPTSVRLYHDQLLVSFLSGFPFLQGGGRVAVVDPATRTENTFISGLSSATDVIWRERGNDRPQFFVLEFSTNMLSNPAGPGRLLRYDSETPTVVAGDLIAPVSMAYSASTQELFILELSGRILRVALQ